MLSPRGAASPPPTRVCGVASDNQAAVDAADTVLLALRAADAPAVLGALTFRPHQRVISVMPSPDVAAISRLLGPVAEVSLGKPASAWRTGPV